jgi:hypothetical protein
MNPTSFLKIAYGSNIAILIPVCTAMFRGSATNTVFNGAVGDTPGLRMLVGSLWTAILAASIAGFVQPRFFAPVLLIQVSYKTLWLVTFVAPLIAQRQPWPFGIAVCFALIVLTYPFLFWFGYVHAG